METGSAMKATHLVDSAASLLQQARRVVAFTGAGISTASGIPDFRSPDCGVWNNVNPHEVASLNSFRQDPSKFYAWIHPLAYCIMQSLPNPAHIALAALECQGIIQSIITQNIDMLHQRAGNQTVHELHGHLREMTCIRCFSSYPAEPIIEQFLEDQLVPHCEHCKGVLKPAVILFGEQLPIMTFLAAKQAVQQADVMLIIGSSLEVAPASDLPGLAIRSGARLIIINLEPTPADALAQVVIHAPAATVLPQILRRLETHV
jgi:NAD-dependent deacetylase